MGTPERILPVPHYDATSSVEATELAQTGRKVLSTPTEKIKINEVPNFPLLGKLTALRFIEWVLKNPGGVISLPTGKTPEHFIIGTRCFGEPSGMQTLSLSTTTHIGRLVFRYNRS